ncbi:MAG: T9SS type A sorting domain-containing protein [Bacteroidota bacterium]|nr:MAG: T9SS type A sorting domain-containing protein [Bacteroidota bacterium]
MTANISNTTGSYTLDWGYPSAPVATYVAGGGNSNSLTLDWGTGNGVIAITASNACCSATKTYNATTNCRESEELTAANFNMYPNPASDVVNIEFWSDKDGMQKDLKVLDLSGRTVMVQKIQTISGRQSVQISLAQFAKGVYMIELNYQRNKLVIE